jgi:hypothetical protein
METVPGELFEGQPNGLIAYLLSPAGWWAWQNSKPSAEDPRQRPRRRSLSVGFSQANGGQHFSLWLISVTALQKNLFVIGDFGAKHPVPKAKK